MARVSTCRGGKHTLSKRNNVLESNDLDSSQSQVTNLLTLDLIWQITNLKKDLKLDFDFNTNDSWLRLDVLFCVSTVDKQDSDLNANMILCQHCPNGFNFTWPKEEN